jgi:hypothetical protein
MPPPVNNAAAAPVNIFELLKSTSSENSEELTALTADNAKLVAKKDRLIALFCESYNITPTFVSRKWDNGSSSLLVSRATVDDLLAAFMA